MKGVKTGGRAQGTPNKVTKELRERISDFLNDNFEQFVSDFATLEADKKIAVFERLLQYSVPKMGSISTPSININQEQPLFGDDTPTFVFKNLNPNNE